MQQTKKFLKCIRDNLLQILFLIDSLPKPLSDLQ